jgi:hypothetical protein
MVKKAGAEAADGSQALQAAWQQPTDLAICELVGFSEVK